MAWSFSSDRPVYIQLAERIQKQIIAGEYTPGQQIPSVRALATEAAVNPNTVQHALSALEADGIIFTRATLGRFVTDDEAVIEICRQKQARNLVKTFVNDAAQMSIPKDELISLIEEALNEHS